MSYQQRLTTAEKTRAADKSRKLKAGQRYQQALHKDTGIQDIYGPLFDSANMIDGWFKADQKGKAQQVTLREYDFPSDNPFDFDTITFQRKRLSEDDSHYQALGAPVRVSDVLGNFPIVVTMPAEYMLDEGEFDFRFHVASEWGDEAYSPATQAILDWTPPAGSDIPDKVQYPFAAGQLIDGAYLAGLPPEGLQVTIPAYAHRHSADRIIWAWLSRLPDGVNLPADKLHDEPLPNDQKLFIPKAVIQNEGEGEGRCYFVYTLYDKAQNVSHLSDFEAVAVSLRDAPGPVLEPLVPLADDGLDYADISAGIEVLIPALVTFEEADKIAVTWGNTPLPVREIGLAPTFPLRVAVPANVLRAEYPDDRGGVVQTAVAYEVRRGLNVWPSNALTIDVDFSIVGPTNPDWPNPVNPSLPALTVKSFTGDYNAIEGPDNHGKDATVEFKLYQPLAKDEVIQLYWNGVAVGAPYTVLGTENPNDTLSLPVTWDEIETAGDNLGLPVWYGIRGPGSANEQRSRIQPVRVLVVPVVLAAPLFPQVGAGHITCSTAHLDHGRIHVQVPADAQYVRDGVEVIVHWRGFERADLSDGLPPHPGDPIPAADDDITLTWSAGNNIAYVEPAIERLFPLQPPVSGYGFCKCYYSIVVNGQTVTSAIIERRVSLGTPAGLCEIPTRAES